MSAVSAEASIEDMRVEASAVVGRRCYLRVDPCGDRAWAVRLDDGARSIHRVCDFERVYAVVMDAAAELASPVARAEGGLASDGWWRDEPVATQRAARQWVRWQLLKRPALSDAHADRFIASLDPPKRTDLIARAKARG